MIVVHMNVLKDNEAMSLIYKDLPNISTLMVNPTRQEVCNELKRNTDPRVLLMGHGSADGLFSKDLSDFVVDADSVPMLERRDVIGFWCYASDFASKHHLHGFFSSMFISNSAEAVMEGYDDEADEKDILAELDIFCLSLNKLLKDNIPLREWPSLFYESCHHEKGYVEFNYTGLSYLEND